MLVRDRRPRTHSILRALPKGDAAGGTRAAPVELLNALMLAKTPLALVRAAEAIGLPCRTGRGGSRETMDAAEARSLVADGTLAEPVVDRLLDECVLDPIPRPDGHGAFSTAGRRPVGDAREAARAYGPLAPDGILANADEATSFGIEPLQDWVLLRNLLSVSMRLAGVARLLTEGRLMQAGMLEASGFLRVDGSRVTRRMTGGSGAFAIPLLYNPYFREGNLVANDLAYASIVDLMCPLLERVAPSEVTRLGSTTVRRVGGSPDLLVLTAPQAGVSRGRVTTRGGKPEAERWLYLTLVGDDQEALADEYLAAIDGLLGRRSLSYGGYASGSVPVAYPDAAASLWATFLRHEKHHVVTCRQCGRSVLAPLQGPRREFCSDTCRAAHAKHLREPFLR